MAEPPAPPRAAIALASATALAYEILLLRLFSITQFHHTAYLVISLALLGYGASGTALALRRRPARFHTSWVALLLAAGVAMPACFAVAQRVMVHPEEMLWRPGQALSLTLVYLVLAVPFLLVGAALGLALMRFRPAGVYAWDLVGAGVGSVGAILLLFAVPAEGALRWVGTVCCLAAVLAAGGGSARFRPGRVAAAALAVAAIWLLPGGWLAPRLSEYKSLAQALRIKGARVVAERSSPLASIAVVESPEVPLRHAPGLSLAVPREPPEQVGIFIDGDVLTPVARADDQEALAYLDYATSAAPYYVARPSSVLVLGAGGGESVLRALRHGAGVVAVELDPQVVELVRDDYGELSGSLYSRPEVEVVVAEAREFVTRDRRRFDLVEHVVAGGLGGGGPALASLSESFLYTVEAVMLDLERLAPDGLLALTTWMDNPPRGPLKMAAIVIAALERRGVEDPAGRLAMLRGWQTSTLLVKDGAFSPGEIERLRAFCRARFFDPVLYPGMDAAEANRYNRLAEPLLHRGVVALMGSGRQEFLDAYAFEVAPATDDRPFFHQFFRWSSLPEVLGGRGRGSLPLLEAGYVVLVATLLQGVVLGGLLVALPLVRLRRAGARSLGRPFVYFGALGLAFLFLEVAFLQRFILFLHHPVYSAAVVLSAFLVFAGLGSGVAERLERRLGDRTITLVAAAIVALGASSLAVSTLASPRLAAAPIGGRVVAAALLIAPLAFFMGMPFPLGLARLRARRPDLVPWAWAVNGCASVISPVAATLLAVHCGFARVILLALAAYAVAGWLAPARPSPSAGAGY